MEEPVLARLLLVVLIGVVGWLPDCGGRVTAPQDKEGASRLVAEGLERARQGDYRGAMEHYDRAIGVDPDNADAYVGRGFARLALGDTPGGEADLQQGSRLRILGWSAAIARNPSDVQARLSRGLARAELGEYRAAIEDYDGVLRVQPANVDAYYLRGNARERLGDRPGAIGDYDAALRLNADFLPAYVARAAAHTALGNSAAATADYEAARRLSGDNQVH